MNTWDRETALSASKCTLAEVSWKGYGEWTGREEGTENWERVLLF